MFGSAIKYTLHSCWHLPISCVISLFLFTAHISAQTVTTCAFEKLVEGLGCSTLSGERVWAP
jgi:hypothetical protein